MSRTVPVGSHLWVKSADEEVVWERAEVLSQAGSVLALRRAAPAGGAPTEDSLDLDFADAHECNDAAGAPADGVPDMTALRHLHEPAVLENLTARVCGGRACAPYTAMRSWEKWWYAVSGLGGLAGSRASDSLPLLLQMSGGSRVACGASPNARALAS